MKTNKKKKTEKNDKKERRLLLIALSLFEFSHFRLIFNNLTLFQIGTSLIFL